MRSAMVTRRKLTCMLYCVLAAGLLVFLLHPERNGRGHYQHLARDEILPSLVAEVSRNLTFRSVMPCDYKAVLAEAEASQFVERPVGRSGDLIEASKIKEGGEYAPSDCRPLYSTAVIVPYRDRTAQLYSFLIYMHNYLRRQRLHYRIYVVEQINIKAFNRAKLLNIGAVRAVRDGFPCLVLHDVDLLPLHRANFYACSARPRHMSSSINKFRYTLPYLTLFGGAVAILASQFRAVNGMSNEYFGWGAEDDDLSQRVHAGGLEPVRFPPEISRYHMATHRAQAKGPKNDLLLSQAASRMQTDGLNSLRYSEISTALHPLFTHVMVDF